MVEPLSGASSSVKPPEEGRLDSWKEIAAYLSRDVTTVQRWEKREGMPVHRHLHDNKGSIYAFSSELDAWQQSRRVRLGEEDQKKELSAQGVVAAEGKRGPGEALSAHPPRWQRWLILGGAAVVVLAVVTYVLNRGPRWDAARPKFRSIAVLPLKNLSGDPSQDYLADGMTESLVGRLSGIRDLRVISRTSVMRFKDTQLSMPEIAKTLGVDALVEGSVIREGNRIRVHAQLIRGATDEHFWSETYDRDLQDVLALESEVAQAIAAKVAVTVTGKEHERLSAAHTISPEVYENYLKGLFALAKSDTRADVEQSIAYFNQAIQKDATFAPAYIGLANAYTELSTVFIGVPPETLRSKILASVRQALDLDPESAEAHIMLADIERIYWQWSEAETQYRRALELKPSKAEAHLGLAQWFLCQGRTEEAMTWAEQARELDPVAVPGTEVGWILFSARHYDQAIQEYRSVLAIRPDDAGALWYLGFALVANNQPDQAIPVLEKALAASGRSPGVMGVLIRAYAHAGRRPDALRLLAELKQRKQLGYVPAAAFVNAYLGLGENDEAFVWLDRAYAEHSQILQFVKVHPYFDPLRNDPRFVQLTHRVGLDK
jgi:TolB-like protein/Tfp pilus assembly protein PilF